MLKTGCQCFTDDVMQYGGPELTFSTCFFLRVVGCLKKLVVAKRARTGSCKCLLSGKNVGQFRQTFRKTFKLSKYKDIIYHFKARGLEISNIQLLSRNIQISRFYEHFKKFREICFCSYFREI